ncbi:hypothetical protein [Aromatoleum evansii]|uniref:hypothetical protein n=1 Tax=Aromatoleum evansii TaxID=59406 RepID=UPI00145C56FE|nr:hypothetical protein [Aromatoleum evansii]NMG29342.1 hypothetical protein [Aromatoleum evansii]
MTVRVSVTHDDADHPATLVVEVFRVGPGGALSDIPVRANHVDPGSAVAVDLRSDDVLVVRELGPLRV